MPAITKIPFDTIRYYPFQRFTADETQLVEHFRLFPNCLQKLQVRPIFVELEQKTAIHYYSFMRAHTEKCQK